MKKILVAALLTASLSIVACSKKNGSSTSGAGDIGIPECDQFITTYEKCIADKVPEASRAAMKTSMDAWKDAWKKAASTPEGKAALVDSCKQAAESSKASLSAMGC